MTKAKQGYLFTENEGEWFFKTGRNRKSKLPIIQLPNFTEIIDNLIDTKQLCQGWITSRKLTINHPLEDPKLYHVRRVRLDKSSNMMDLSDTNIIKLINERNEKNDNDNIKHWLTDIVDKSNEHKSSTLPQYTCKKDASKLHEKKAPPSLSKHNKLSINNTLIWDQAYIEGYYGYIRNQKRGNIYLKQNIKPYAQPLVMLFQPTQSPS